MRDQEKINQHYTDAQMRGRKTEKTAFVFSAATLSIARHAFS